MFIIIASYVHTLLFQNQHWDMYETYDSDQRKCS